MGSFARISSALYRAVSSGLGPSGLICMSKQHRCHPCGNGGLRQGRGGAGLQLLRTQESNPERCGARGGGPKGGGYKGRRERGTAANASEEKAQEGMERSRLVALDAREMVWKGQGGQEETRVGMEKTDGKECWPVPRGGSIEQDKR